MKPRRNSWLQLFLGLAGLIFLSASAQGTITNVVWYRLGESDPGGRSGTAVTNTTQDLIGTKNLKQYGGPAYSGSISTTASGRVGSSLSVNFNGTSQYLSNTIVSTVINNFALEVWAKPSATDTGNRTIVYNGNPLSSGWGLIQRAGTEFRASLGTMTAFGSGVAAAGVWTHLAVVRDNGTTTFYVNGVASGSSSSNPIPPAVSFMVGAHPDLVANTYFNGAVDEIRVFTFAPGQFSTNDLLLNAQRVTTLPATTLSSATPTLNGSVNAIGLPSSAWFEWGATTNYGNVTDFPQSFGAGTATANYSRQISGAPPHTYHYRAVCSNSLGVARGSNVVFALTNTMSGSAGGGQPIALGQPALELNFIICTNGVYPGTGGATPQPFVGEVRLFAGAFAPAGWLFCHGQLLSVDELVLFSLIGTTYGGDGATNYALPDFRGRTIVSPGQGPGLAPFLAGEISGTTQSTLFLQTIPAHTHTLPTPFVLSGSTGVNSPRLNRQPTLALTLLLNQVGNYPNSATTYEPFTAQMQMFAGSFAPGSTAFAQGQALAINQNTALYSLLGTNFGGNGATTFQLPDLRGRTPVGAGQGAGLTARTNGQMFGAETVTMTTNQLPTHRHSLPYLPPLGTFTGFTGSNQPQSLIQPSLGLRFLISTNGELPSPTVEATNKMIGEIAIYAGVIMPGGWTSCDGQQLSVVSYPQLFSVLSNRFGGDGVTTFALPDLRGRIPIGSPTGQPGTASGAEQFVLTEAQLPAHAHSAPSPDYSSWCDILGLAGGPAAFDADADGDGAPNGLEWAAGTGLTNSASTPGLTIVADGAQAKIGFTRNTNATDVTILLQRTPTLANSNAWSGLVTNALSSWSSPGSVSETGTDSVKVVEVSDALTNNAAVDYRLKITRP